MTTRYRYEKLKEAAKALERAAQAAWMAEQYPHSRVSPCVLQMEAAQHEISCASGLMDQAEIAERG